MMRFRARMGRDFVRYICSYGQAKQALKRRGLMASGCTLRRASSRGGNADE